MSFMEIAILIAERRDSFLSRKYRFHFFVLFQDSPFIYLYALRKYFVLN